VISQCEWDEIIAHSAMVIHFNKPMQDQVTDKISWIVATPGVLNTDGKTLLTSNAVFVTRYDQLQHDPKLIFLGSYYSDQPAPDDWALVIQREEHSIGPEDVCIDVGQVYSQCYASKPNIVDGNSSNHHGNYSGIYGFGARHEFGGINAMNGSSLGRYVCFKGQEAVANGLEMKLIKQMTMTHDMVHIYANQDLHKMNAVQLMATEQQALAIIMQMTFT